MRESTHRPGTRTERLQAKLSAVPLPGRENKESFVKRGCGSLGTRDQSVGDRTTWPQRTLGQQ